MQASVLNARRKWLSSEEPGTVKVWLRANKRSPTDLRRKDVIAADKKRDVYEICIIHEQLQ